MNQQDASRASSLGNNLFLAILIGCATVMTACPPDTLDAADTTRPDYTPLVSDNAR